MAERAYVYILASKLRGVLYLGVTTNLATRVEQHKSGAVPSFTARHRVNRFVWFQGFDDIRDAIDHEKRLKRWRREWKIKLIEASNPNWDELHSWLRKRPVNCRPGCRAARRASSRGVVRC